MNVALTFDDGPSQWTADIVELLNTHQARATFFLVGQHAADHPLLVDMIRDGGHEVGVHTFTHPHLSLCDDETVERELEETLAILDFDCRWWRAPYLEHDHHIDAIAATLGLSHVSPTIAPPDWRLTGEQTASYVAERLADGAIVGLHDGVPPDGGTGRVGRRETVSAVALLLDQPVTFCRIPEAVAA